MSGVFSAHEAIMEMLVLQSERDTAKGLKTAILVSGYPGSPLSEVDSALRKNHERLQRHRIHYLPGVNEELSATALMGSQMAALYPGNDYDGILGLWFGKSPGADRSGDAFRHGNYAGVSEYGGVLVLVGDDATCSSSALPSCSIITLYDNCMPVLCPGNLRELIEFGLFGFELSRYSGLWVGIKVSSVIGGLSETLDFSMPFPVISKPEPGNPEQQLVPRVTSKLLPPWTMRVERDIYTHREANAIAMAAVNGLNPITCCDEEKARLGILAAGEIYYHLMAAFALLGLKQQDLQQYDIRLLKLGMVYPLDPDIIIRFTNGLERLVVIEEKRGFIESGVKSILYSESNSPVVCGKQDEYGAYLFPPWGGLDAETIAVALEPYLQLWSTANTWLSPVVRSDYVGQGPQRLPHFCPGCPHSRSTRLPADALTGLGVGCHGIQALHSNDIGSMTQMGGEGVQLVGMSPFLNMPHQFQNIGDGTFFHSGSLAIRQAVVANSNITFKLLYNSTIAMTDSPLPKENISTPVLVMMLYAEGVRQVAVVSDDIRRYQDKLDQRTMVGMADDLDTVQTRLSRIKGVTVLIYDRTCALASRRDRQNNNTPLDYVYINQQLCEGCDQCVLESGCLSLLPEDTEFGRKLKVDQASCNHDLACIKALCPALVTIKNGRRTTFTTSPLTRDIQIALPDPIAKTGTTNLYITGMGGTGVTTMGQILASAASADGKFVSLVNKKGLSQRAGVVGSHLKISEAPDISSPIIVPGSADAYIVLDVWSALEADSLKLTCVDKTVAVISTARFSSLNLHNNVLIDKMTIADAVDAIQENTDRERNVCFDFCELAELAFNRRELANVIILGTAYQRGIIPLARSSLESAIVEALGDGIAVRQAFLLGRKLCLDPDALFKSVASVKGTASNIYDRFLLRIRELEDYQDIHYAKKYQDFVRRVLAVDESMGHTELSTAVILNLYQLMASKDEYEVARLYLKPDFQTGVKRMFGHNAALSYHFALPFSQKKFQLPSWGKWFLKLLRYCRFLRDSRFDIFAYSNIRKLEKEALAQYQSVINRHLDFITHDNYKVMVEFAQLPEQIRGYGQVKINTITAFLKKAERLGFVSRERIPTRHWGSY
ncbi:indolepyruvate ferredoxin oxidoreductase family protein [Endozoicomonas sp. YOMI1]|uniref:indolepyruvate ferredoxin oxidoreductase family protein n=1 Tax=Endozoicomonas sp. YOMI1 TaxID=2828739 RepID=UPI0021484D07|nr:indolepyruvate ferredoxin oxidoreductase family protein [Endozoicomonas sp. YOMI1]